MIVHRQKCVVRFGFVHLVATNIAMWLSTAVSEIQTDYTVSRHQPVTPTVTSTTGNNPSNNLLVYVQLLLRPL